MKATLIERSISWKTVFNTALRDTFWNGIDHANQTARSCGYKFFAWNGWVYEVDGNSTEIHVEMLDEQLTKNDSIVLTLKELQSFHELPADDQEESEIQTAYRMGRNGLVLALISKIKEPDYESN